MPSNELKCIEVLIHFLAKKSDLSKEIDTEFTESTTYEETRPNLFNLISINDLIEHYSNTQPFSLESFLNTGIIPGMYEEKTITPSIDPNTRKDYKSFYNNLIKALKEDNYLFDENNNIYISSLELEATIPQIWLYRLSQAIKRNNYDRMYFFNKNKENNITDKNALLDYLHHTKTFKVSLTSSDPNIDYQQEFTTTEERTNKQITTKGEIKVSDIITTFQEQLSPNVQCKISKYKLSDAFFIISKAESMGRDFYSEPLSIQKKYLNKWMLEYINSNEYAKKETQKFVVVASPKNIHGYDLKDFNRRECIIGLLNLYFSIINKLNIDYTYISLSDFKISEYRSPKAQADMLELLTLIKRVNSYHENQAKIRKEILEMDSVISSLDLLQDKELIESKQEDYRSLTELLELQEKLEAEYNDKRNQLQEIIRLEQQESIETIAFDNDVIFNLLMNAVTSGRVYFKQGTNIIIFEVYNDELGKTVFKASINLEKLLTFIENLNYSLEEIIPPTVAF